MASPQITVSIGRNYGPAHVQAGMPMSYRRWNTYKAEVSTLFMYNGTVIGSTFGRSVWRYDDSSEWTYEQSFTIYVTDVDPADHPAIRRQLSYLAHKYGQDSIAVTVADPTFITAVSPS